jgi:hypothetical protein
MYDIVSITIVRSSENSLRIPEQLCGFWKIGAVFAYSYNSRSTHRMDLACTTASRVSENGIDDYSLGS